MGQRRKVKNKTPDQATGQALREILGRPTLSCTGPIANAATSAIPNVIPNPIKRRHLSHLGQASTEYILILAVAAMLGTAVVRTLIKPAYAQVSSLVSNAIQNTLFGVNLHVFNVPGQGQR